MGQGSVALMNFAFIPIYIRYLGIEAYGLVGILATLQTILGIFDMGLTLTLNREFAGSGNSRVKKNNALSLLKSVEVLIAIICTLIFGLTFALSDWLSKEWINSQNLTNNEIKDFFIACGLIVSLRLIEGIYKSVIVGLQRQVIYNLILVFLSALRSVGAVIVVIYIAPTMQAFFLWQVIASIVSVVLWYVITHKIIATDDGVVGRFSLKILKENASYSMGILGMSLLSLMVTNLDKIFLPKLINLTDYGFYALASSLSGILILLVGPVVQAAFPRLSEFHANNDQISFVKVFHKCSQLISIMVGSVSSIIIYQPNLILELWNVDILIIENTSPLLSVLTFGTLLNCLMWIPYQVALSSGHPSLLVKLNTVGVIMMAPLFAWIVPLYGSIGSAWIWVLCNMYFMVFGSYLIFKKIIPSEFYAWLIEDISKPILAIFIFGYFASEFFTQFHNGYIMSLVIVGLVLFLSILVGIVSSNNSRNSLVLKAQDLLNKFKCRFG
jgi:O-antigen/teichoic acid export membrane protein